MQLQLISLVLVAFSSAASAKHSTASPSPLSRTQNQPGCQPITLRVRVTAETVVYEHPPSPHDPNQIVSFAHACLANTTGPLVNGTATTFGTFRVHGTYCRPPSRRRGRYHNTIQLLVHGWSHNRRIWSGLGFGGGYDWQAQATARGYHTLAIDRLGHGADRHHPDPLGVVQGALQAEIIHQVIGVVRRSGYRRVVYVGHSYGTVLGVAVAGKYPNDIDVLVATGFTSSLNDTVMTDLLQLTPAAHVNTRFGRLPLGYLASRSKAGREEAFHGFCNDRIPRYDFKHQDTVTLGELCFANIVEPAVNFVNPVLAVVGKQDKLFCDDTPTTCFEKSKDTGRLLFPNAQYGVYVPGQTGHALMVHYTAPQTIHIVHSFLDYYFS